MSQLAAEAAQRGPATPIPLIAEGTRAQGAVYDQYLLGVVVARAARAAGQPADAATIAAHPLWRSRGTVVVAYPIDCDGRPNRPLAIRWKVNATLPVSPSPIGEAVRGSEAQGLLPGVGLPDDALVMNVRNALMFNASAEIDYANPVCHGAARTAVAPIAVVPSRDLAMSAFNGVKLPGTFAALPSPTTVRVRVMLDAAGRARFPEQVQGPPELGPTAIEALNARTFPPSTTNGVPTPLSLMATFVFTSTGASGQAEPYNPAPPPGMPGTMVTARSTTVAVPSSASAPPPNVAPAPAGQLETQLARLAIEVASKGDPTPIPLDAAGPPVHGVVFDRFLVGALKARAAFIAGKPFDPSAASPALVMEDLVAVAFPLACNGRAVAPQDLRMSVGGTRPGVLRPTGGVLTGASLADRLPGVTLPSGAVGRAFVNAAPSLGLEAQITYAEPCRPGDAPTLALPIQWVRGLSQPHLSTVKLPESSTLPSPTVTQVRGIVDLDGAYRFGSLADGPAELAATAIVATSAWKFTPYRANGVASPQGVITSLTFTRSGIPEPMPPTISGGGATAPPVTASSSVGGRTTGDLVTPEAPGLSLATSQCEVASTSSYGRAPDEPVKTGGGAGDGPGRERRYLSSLRGPAGQGLRITRRGSLMAPDRQAVLDLYEITYAGLDTPIRIYLDEYHDESLKAPQGLVCASPFVVR